MNDNNIIDTEAWLEDFLTGLLEQSGLDLWVSGLEVNEDTNTYVAQLNGDDKALAIGRDGQVLDAFQHLLVSAAANAGIFTDRLIVDIDGYRQRSDDQLKEDAQLAVSETLDTQRAIDLEPMNARERRLVHLLVSTIEGVESQSVGSGEDRFVQLIPAK